MTRPLLPRPDTMPLREALRGLRFLLRRGRETVGETLPLDALPPPAASLASAILRETDDLARSVDALATRAAETVFGRTDSPSAPLDQIIHGEGAETRFAQAIYLALGTVLRRFGCDSVFVSELAARAAFVAWRREGPAGEAADWLADLTLRLRDAPVIRGAPSCTAAGVPVRGLDAVAIFAVLLWLQSARSDAENEAALASAADIALVRANEIAGAVQAGGREAIAALYRKYVDHV